MQPGSRSRLEGDSQRVSALREAPACDHDKLTTGCRDPLMDIENKSFRTSILYWIGVLESTANIQFVRDMGGGKANVARWRTLSTLSELNGATINELASYTQIERTALSHLLAQMEREALLIRRPRKSDRRVIEVHLLPKGQETFRQMLPVRRAVILRATKGITPDELQTMMSVTQRLVANLQACDDPETPDEPDGSPV